MRLLGSSAMLTEHIILLVIASSFELNSIY